MWATDKSRALLRPLLLAGLLLRAVAAAGQTAPPPADATAIADAAAARPIEPAPRHQADNSADAADSAALGRTGGGPWKVSALATADLLANTSGGLKRGIRLLDKLAVAAAYDAGGDWIALASAQYTNGTPFSQTLAGDTQTVSNIEAIGSVRVYEVWLARRLQRGGVKFGLIDLNSEFDVQEAGGLFLNSSNGIAAEFSHTGRNGPSIFPATSLAATGFYVPADGWTLRLGVFDGVPGDPAHPRRFAIKLSGKDGALVVAQATRRWGDRLRFEAGAWHYTAAFPLLDTAGAARRRVSRGAYGLVEARLHDGGDTGRTLTGWLRAGIADGRVNRIDGYLGGGVVLAAPFAGRQDDSTGISVMHAAFGSPARRAEPGLRSGETTVELTYRAPVAWGITIQPDLQYVIHPNGTPGVGNALVAGVRLTLAR